MGLLFNLGVGIVTVIAILVGWVYRFYQRKFLHWESKNVKYAVPSFPIGNLKGLGSSKNLGEIIKDLYDGHKYSRFFGVWQFFQPTLIVNDPELIKNILVSDFMHFHDHGVYYNEKKDPLAANLFSIEGTKWRNLRVKMTPTFTSGKMKMMFPIMKECGEGLEQLFHATAIKGGTIEAKDVISRYSSDIIASAAFGITTNTLKNPDSIFREMGRKVFAPNWQVIITNMLAFLIPDLAKFLQLRVTPADVSDFFLGTVKETMDYREMNDIKRNDFLQLLIQLKNKGFVDDPDSGTKGELSESSKFTFEQAAAQAFIFFVAGFETSSATLQFTMLELALNHDIQNKLRSEIRRVLAKHNNEVTYDAVQEMEYMGRVMDESLRKYPPAALMTRMCTKNYKIPDSNVLLEKGTMVLIPAYGMHMDERYFPNPEVFDPERFTEEEKQNRHKYTYLPFGEGPRVCIGQRFAQLQIRVALVYMLNKYQLDISPEDTPLPIVFDPKGLNFMPKGGVNLRVSSLRDIGLTLITVVTVLVGWLYWFYQRKFRHWEYRNVEHTKPSFLVGDLKGVGSTKNFGVLIKELYDEHKTSRFFGMWQFFQPTFVVNDPELIKNILISDFMHFHDHGGYYNEKKDPLSANLFTIEGTKWRNLRVKLTPTFTSGKMKMMFPIMKECGEELAQILHKSAVRNETIEAKDLIARYSTDVISSAAFGISANSLKNPDSIFRVMGRKFFEPNWKVLMNTILAFLVPDVAKLLQITVTEKDISEFFMGTVRETIDYREMNDIKRNDFMQLLIHLKNKGFIDHPDSEAKGELSDNSKFTFEQAAAQAFIFFVGGFESSSLTLQFTMLELALNHDIQNKLRSEMKRVLAKHNNEVTYDAVLEMEYMGRVVDETMRKYPPFAVLSRMCTKDYKIPDSNLLLEKGTSVIIPLYGLHRDERYFPNPEVFDPERFSEEEKQNRHKYTYLPFEDGPRVCIGQRFAQLQIRVALVYMLNKYQLDISPEDTPLPIVFDPKSMNFMPKGGMNLRVSLLKE